MKLSVITVSYQNLKGLRQTIESVLCQSWTDFEHVIVDGGSEDGTKELLQSYEAIYASHNISYRWVSEKDDGIYHAMNKGVRLAVGEYCNFLNAGDCFCDKEALAHVFAEYNPHNILIGKARTTMRVIEPPKHISISFFYYHGSINHQAAFIRKELLLKHPYNETKGLISSDYQFFIESLLVDGCSYRPLDVMVVDFDANGISSQPGILQKIQKEQSALLATYYNTAELGDVESLKYDNYKIVQMAKRMVGVLVAIKKATRLKTYDTCLRVNRNPSKALLFRRMIRANLNRVRFYFQVGHKVKKQAITTSPRETPLIVSLTSYPARMGTIVQTLSSLMTQTTKPDKIILWLTEEQYPKREADLPIEVLDLRKFGLTIEWCSRPIRSYTKLIPTLQKYPDAIIVTADDDIQYRKKWLEGLYNAYLKAPNLIHCYCAPYIRFDEKKQLLPYNQWEITHTELVSYRNLLLGVGGVLYPPRSLHTDILKEEVFMQYAPHADDLWFWAMAVLNGTQIHTLKNKSSRTIPVSNVNNEFALFNENSIGENDRQFHKLLELYPLLKERLM